MNNMSEIQSQLTQKEDYAVSLELEILEMQDQIQSETDETHIIFLTDHLGVLQYELDKVNADIYYLRKNIKLLENQGKFLHPLNSDFIFNIMGG